ncbi:MAG: porin [Bacteroidetes bacterium]|nr:porin [Bacteroidota bacterium]
MYKYILILISFFCSELRAQNTNVVDSISFYGWIRQHIAVYDKNMELQDNSPRIGTSIYRKLQNGWWANAQLEYGIHIVQGISFNKDANSAQQLIANPFVTAAAFTPRLATVEMGHPIWGTITIGKQWGVYYDIGFYTDNFNLFGGSANGVYAGGTDGGWSGTGRADKAIQYRNHFRNWELGVQTQLFGNSANFGIAAQYHFPTGLSIGAAYNSAKISTQGQFLINDIGKTNNNFIAGIKYNKGKLYAAITSSINNGDIITVNDSTILALATNGYEMSLGYILSQKWSFDGGLNLAVAKKYNQYLHGHYRLLQYIAGVDYFITPMTRIYASIRMSDSKFVDYLDAVNVYALGFRYDFDFSKGNFLIK